MKLNWKTAFKDLMIIFGLMLFIQWISSLLASIPFFVVAPAWLLPVLVALVVIAIFSAAISQWNELRQSIEREKREQLESQEIEDQDVVVEGEVLD